MYWIVEALSSFVFTFLICLLIRRKTKKWIVSIYFLFFVVGSLTSFGILHINGSYSYYEFLDFGIHTLSKVMKISAIVYVNLFFVILLMDYFLIKRMNKSELAIVSGIRILPFVSAQFAMIIIGIVFSIFCVIDNIMPQYGLWNVDNQNIQLEKYGYHITNVTRNDYGYPLWMIDDYPLDINSLADKKKIMIIGDSFIWGDGCSNSNYLWWRQLQRKLLEDGYQDCTIIGVGRCGASTQDQLGFLENTGIIEDINPDMILIGYVTNDAQYRDSEGNTVPKQADPVDYFSGNVKGCVKNAFPNMVYLINQYLNERRYNIDDFNADTGFPPEQWEMKIIRGEYLERYKEESINPMGKFAKSLDIPFILVATPNIPSAQYYEERYGSVLPLFEKVGITVFNPLEEYVSAYEKDTHYADGINIVNSHPGTAANMLLADYVRDLLENEYEEYLGKQSSPKKISNQVNDWFPHAVMPMQQGQKIQFVYPASVEAKRFLYMPIKKPYIKLCFDAPINISKIKICGEMLESESGEVYATFENSEKGYDSQELVKLGVFHNSNDTISVDLSNITSLCVHIDIKSWYDRKFSVTLTK